MIHPDASVGHKAPVRPFFLADGPGFDTTRWVLCWGTPLEAKLRRLKLFFGGVVLFLGCTHFGSKRCWVVSCLFYIRGMCFHCHESWQVPSPSFFSSNIQNRSFLSSLFFQAQLEKNICHDLYKHLLCPQGSPLRALWWPLVPRRLLVPQSVFLTSKNSKELEI